MTLVWISKPVVSRIGRCIEEEAMSLSVFLLFYLRFSLSLSQFQSIFMSFVSISAVLCRCYKPAMSLRLSAQPINLVNRKVLHKTWAWRLRNFTDLQTFKEEPQEHDNAINHFRDHTLYNSLRRQNIGQRDISCMTQVFDSGSSRCGLVWYYRFKGRKIKKNQYSVLKLR